jgi:hypothetical protein
MSVNINIKSEPKNIIKPMNEMQPGEAGIIQGNSYNGELVLRTLDSDKFEVMNLSCFSPNKCWNELSTLPVKPVNLEIDITVLK